MGSDGFRWFRIVSGWIRVGSGGFGWFRVVSCFINNELFLSSDK